MKFQLNKKTVVTIVIGTTLVIGGQALASPSLTSTLANLASAQLTLPTLPSLPSFPNIYSIFSAILGNKASTMIKNGYLDPNNALQQNASPTAVADGVVARLGLNEANSKVIENRLADTSTAMSHSDGADNSLDATKQGNKMIKYLIEQQAQNTQTTQGLADLAVANQHTLNKIQSATHEERIDAQAMARTSKPFLFFSGN